MENLFRYAKNVGGYTLITYYGDEEKVVILDTYQGEAVTAIAKGTFPSNNKIKEIVLPKNLIKIDKSCFSECQLLEKIDIPRSVTNIGMEAFVGCKALKEISIPPNVKYIHYLTFGHCTNLSKVTFNEGLVGIYTLAFDNCQKLEEIILPKSVIEIKWVAFKGCTNLKRVTTLNDDLVLELSPFDDCNNLEEVSSQLVPLLNIEQRAGLLKYAFYKNKGFSTEELTSIEQDVALKNFLFESNYTEIIVHLLDKTVEIDLDDLNKFIDISIKENRPAITAIYLDYRNTKFSSDEISAEIEQKELREIGLELPNFKELEKDWHCIKKDDTIHILGYKGSETHATIPVGLNDNSKIVSIYTSRSTDYKALESLTIEAEITQLEKAVFSNCISLSEIILPNTLLSIEDNAFNSCRSLQSIILPPNLEKIKTSAFELCHNLEEVIIPTSVTEIGDSAFKSCHSLTKVNFLGEFPEIGENAFSNCPVEKEILSKL